MTPLGRLSIVVLLAMLGGCSMIVERDGSGVGRPRGSIVDAVPSDEPRSKSGNPESYVVFGKRYRTLKTAQGFAERGVGSWYGKKFHGRKTASGEIYDMYKMTAAHTTLPLPTYVEVTNLDNRRSAIVKVNDRGPFHDNRVIDLSYAAALKLGMVDSGTAFVEIRAINARGEVTMAASSTAVQAAADPNAAPAATGMYLQVGAFRELTNANRLADRVGRVISDKVHVRQIMSGAERVHRVQIGPIASVEIADTIVLALKHAGIADHHFIKQ